MKISVSLFIFVLSLILVTQVISLLIQYRINKNYRGIGYWLLGSSSMALGFVLMPLVAFKPLEDLARLSNPLLVLGYVFLYIGVKQFLNSKFNKWIPIAIFLIFNLFYNYFMYIDNSISYRTLVLAFTIALISFMIAYPLFYEKEKSISGSANFTASLFLIYGGFFLFRFIYTSILPSINTYTDQGSALIAGFIISIVVSNLWTFGLIIMVNQRLNMDNQLEKEKFQSIFNTNIDAQLITRFDDGLIVDVNGGFSLLSGYTRDEVLGYSDEDMSFWNSPDDRTFFTTELKDKGILENVEFIFHRKDKSPFNGMISARVITIHDTRYIINVVRDITERKQFETALMESEEKYRSILNASPDDITITDLEGNIIMVSPAANAMFGYESDFTDFIGMKLLDFIIPEDVERAKSNILKMHKKSTPSPNEYRGLRLDGGVFDVEVNSGFVYNNKGIPIKMVFIVRDISERKQAEIQIQKLLQQLELEKRTAQHNSVTDSLTGLANRRHFDEALEMEFFRLRGLDSLLSLIMVDIDYFKGFNDSYGHLAGDQCLQQIATKLKSIPELSPDIVARYGGEEFIVILPHRNEKEARVLGERIRSSIEELCIPHINSDISNCVTVSVGIITINPNELEEPMQAFELVDEALYSAKERGRNCCVFTTNIMLDQKPSQI